MTALMQYQRLESTGLWRETATAQRREVVVSVGDATLTISDLNDRALTHWSLAAVARANPGEAPAIYHPDGDPDETLELDPQEAAEMIAAIDKLRSAINRTRPRPGRLRLISLIASFSAVAALAVFWLPGAMRDHATEVVPQAKRHEIGTSLRNAMQRVTGPNCAEPAALAALRRLAQRLPDPRGRIPDLQVVRNGVRTAEALPGGAILINATLIESNEQPDVVAGYILAAQTRAALSDPLRALLDTGGFNASFRLLTTGIVPEPVLLRHAEALAAQPPAPPPDEALLAAFARAGVRATPYAYALDITGESTLPLIEADPFATRAPDQVVLSDGDWLRLQGICGN